MPFERATSWGHGGFDERGARNEERVRRDFWRKAARVAAKLPFAEDLLAAYYCAFDQTTPFQVRAALVGALAYFVLPFDFVPDVLPLLGFTDDAAVLLTALRLYDTPVGVATRTAKDAPMPAVAAAGCA